jgi:membrane peptidoglycan carboxypeptidase
MQPSLRIHQRRLRRLQGQKATGPLAPVLVLLAAGIAGLVLTGSVSALALYSHLIAALPPNPEVTFAGLNMGPAKIYDRHGKLLYEFEDETEGLRNPVKLYDISPYLIEATIATEDASFYTNPGVNVRGLVRAGVENFITADSGLLQGSGGSSITQQLVKNVFIPPEERYERSVARKLKETVFSLELTRRYSKDQILEWYLNQIYYGNRATGVGAAARRYFGTTAKDLTLAQAALLAGLPQSPARYDPYRNREAAIARQHEVLDLMVRHGYITREQAEAAKAEELVFAENKVTLLAPHWVFYVRDLLVNLFGLETFRSGGLQVITTLDLDLQQKAEQIVEEKIAYYESPRGGNCRCHNGALVAIDNETGQILVMVGSRNYWRTDIEGENNNAIAVKQPGSAFKPVVYLAAFEKGWTPGTIVYDQPTRFLSRFEGGRPEYFIPQGPIPWQGPMTVRDALGNSMNTPAVKAANFAGVDAVIEMAHRMGITTMEDRDSYGVSIATGGANLTLLDLTFVYSVLANNGEMRGVRARNPRPGYRDIDPAALLRVTDGRGRVLYDYEQEQARKQVVQAGYAYQITDILKDNNAKRRTYTAPEWQFGMPDKRPVAAKTGTQQGPKSIRDVLATWNFGYIPQLTVGVWVGNADNSLVNPNLTSASSSLLIWKEFMAAAIDMLHLPPKDFTVPPDIEWRYVNGHREPLVKGAKVILSEGTYTSFATGLLPTAPLPAPNEADDRLPGWPIQPVRPVGGQPPAGPTPSAGTSSAPEVRPVQPQPGPAVPPARGTATQPEARPVQPQPEPERPQAGPAAPPPPVPVQSNPPGAPPTDEQPCRPQPPLYLPCTRR